MPLTKKDVRDVVNSVLANRPKPKKQNRQKSRPKSSVGDSMSISRFDLIATIKANTYGTVCVNGKTFPSLNAFGALFSTHFFNGQLTVTYVPSGSSSSSGTIYLGFGVFPSGSKDATQIAADKTKLARYKMVTGSIRNKVSLVIKASELYDAKNEQVLFGVELGTIMWNTADSDAGGELWVRYNSRLMNPKA